MTPSSGPSRPLTAVDPRSRLCQTGRFHQVMLDLAKVVHDAIGIESPRTFIAIFAVIGLLSFGGLGWLIDKGYRVRLRQGAPVGQQSMIAAVGPREPPPKTEVPTTPHAKPRMESPIQKKEKEKIVVPEPKPQTIISAPGGIAIGGGTVTNPTVNNYVGPPQRRLTDEQASQLVESLRPFAGTKVLIRLNQVNGESGAFGQRLADVLKSAGIDVTDVQPVLSFPPGPPPPIAFVIDRTKKNQEPLALALGEALHAMKIIAVYGVNPPQTSGNPEFLILDIYPLG